MSKRDEQQAKALEKRIAQVLEARHTLRKQLSQGKYNKQLRDKAERARRAVRSSTRPQARLAEALQSNAARKQNEQVAARFRQAGSND